MKTLYLLRHAKSSWKDDELMDIDRPLNRRGLTNAPLMGKHFRKLRIKPQLIISSPAKRALSTALIVAREIDYPEKNIKIDMGLYGANVEELLQAIHQIESSIHKIMLVGHNPGLTLLINYLTKDAIDNLPTCGLVQINLKVKDWKESSKNSGKLALFEFPKKLEN